MICHSLRYYVILLYVFSVTAVAPTLPVKPPVPHPSPAAQRVSQTQAQVIDVPVRSVSMTPQTSAGNNEMINTPPASASPYGSSNNSFEASPIPYQLEFTPPVAANSVAEASQMQV